MAVISKARIKNLLKATLNNAVARINEWMEGNNLKLVPQKSELTLSLGKIHNKYETKTELDFL